MKPSSQYLLSI